MDTYNNRYYGIAGNTADYGKAVSEGDKGIAANTGGNGWAYSNAERGIALNTGHYGGAVVFGRSSLAVTSGEYSIAAAMGENSVAFANGKYALAGGKKGTFLICTEYEAEDCGGLLDLQVRRVDGDIIRENMLYCLENGRWRQVKEIPHAALKEAAESGRKGNPGPGIRLPHIGKRNLYNNKIRENKLWKRKIWGEEANSILMNQKGDICSEGDFNIAIQDSGCYGGTITAALGRSSLLVNRGNLGTLTAAGIHSAAIRFGDIGTVVSSRKESIAAALGKGGMVKGAAGCYLLAAEYERDSRNIHDIRIGKVDGKKLLPNQYYVLQDGEFTDVRVMMM